MCVCVVDYAKTKQIRLLYNFSFDALVIICYHFLFNREHHPKQEGPVDVLEVKSDLDFYKHLRLTRK